VEGGQLYFEDGSWQRPKMDDMIIPQSVRVAIQSRIANLPEEDQEILRLAAILGREFDFDTLVEASELGEDQLIDALERAEHAQLIEPASGLSFTFAHALIPSTLVEGVHMLRRRRLHRQAAAAIERLRPEDFEALAYHFGEAGDEARALNYYTKAGEKASKVYANQEAASHFQAALNLADSEEEQAYLHSELGVVLARQSRFEAADKSWRKAIIIYEDEGNLDRISWSYARMARAAWDAGDTIGGLELCLEGLGAVRGAPESQEMADLLHETARAYSFSGRKSEGQPLCEMALEMAEKTGAVVVQAEALITRALLGDPQNKETIRLLEQAIQLCQENNLLAQESRASNNLSISLGIHGDIKACREHLRRASELSARVGDLGMELFTATNELFWATWQGELDYVGEQFSELEVTLESMIDPGSAGSTFSRVRAYWLWARGDVDKSLSRLRILKAELVEGGDLQGLSSIANISLGPLLELREYDEAEANIEEAIQISDRGIGSKIFPRMLKLYLPQVQEDSKRSQQVMEEIRQESDQNDTLINRTWLHTAEAHYLATKGQWQEANKSFDTAIELALDMNLKLMAHWIRTYSERLVESRNPDNLNKARKYLGQARELFEEMGVPYYIGKVDDLSQGLDDILGKGRIGVK
jgi:tetratricopeptide (TPR) repeat protein